MNIQNEIPQTESEHQTDSSKLVMIIVLSLAFLVSIGIYYFLTQRPTTKTIQTTLVAPTESAGTQESASSFNDLTTVSTTGWKTFSGNAYTIQYPNTLELKHSIIDNLITQDSFVAPNEEYTIFIGSYAGTGNPSIIQFQGKISTDQQIQIAGLSTRKISGIERYSNKGTLIHVGPISVKGENIMLVYTSGTKPASAESLNIFNTMLSTFSLNK